jgi:hypothetical protein
MRSCHAAHMAAGTAERCVMQRAGSPVTSVQPSAILACRSALTTAPDRAAPRAGARSPIRSPDQSCGPPQDDPVTMRTALVYMKWSDSDRASSGTPENAQHGPADMLSRHARDLEIRFPKLHDPSTRTYRCNSFRANDAIGCARIVQAVIQRNLKQWLQGHDWWHKRTQIERQSEVNF